MTIQELIKQWQQNHKGKRTARAISIHLPVTEAAKILALAEIYPDQTETQIITDLLAAALDELEKQFPYIASSQQVAMDENGDPIYADVGLTPTFLELTKKYQRMLENESTS